ncbi:MAG: FimV/HubP family polar landmark protein, partial [Candidatus Thiodiazotropha sp.]
MNQSFNADIDLLSVDQQEVQDVRVELASQDAFDKAGIERPFYLSGLKFKPMLTPSGKSVIEITSDDPIREPFLNFLVEVNWPKGRLVREYTVLLDPPVTLNRAPQPVAAPRMSVAPARQTAAAPARQAMPAPAMTTSMGGAREYGPVQPNDNLWSIAKGMRHQEESVEQVMMALQRYNPDAFINDNVNNLKVGKVLRLPESADVTSLSRQQARQEFLAQTRAWRTGKPAAVSGAGAPATGTVAKTEDRLKLISAKPEGGKASTREGKAEVGRLEQEILLVRESNESALQENEALRDRVSELEKQIEDIQRLVTLKSDELAKMQAAQQVSTEKMAEAKAAEPSATPETAQAAPEAAPAETEAAPAPAETETAPAPAESEMAAKPAEEAAPATPMAEGAMTGETAKAEAPATPEETTAPAAEAEQQPPATTEEPAMKPEEPKVAQVVPPPPVETPAAPMPEKKVSYFDNIKGNTTMMGIVGAVAVLLIALLWMIMRRRKEAEAEFAESILVSPDSEVAIGGKDAGDTLTEPSDETSFMSDFSPSDIDALQDETGEVDPLSEADVYIAYGRYQQAEELIKQAIDKFPEREELKHKLLEIYFSAKKSGEFTRLAETLKEGGLENSNPDAWSRVISMGKELNPTHALFAGAAGVAGATLTGDDDLDDLGLDLSSDFAEAAKGAENLGELGGEELDSMDLSGLDNLDEMDSESLEADLSLDSEFLDKMESGKGETAETLDFDLDSLSEDSETAAARAQENVLDLDDLDAKKSGDAIDLEDSESLDDLDLESIERELENLSEDLDDQTAGEPLELPEGNSEDLSLDLDSTDEVTTKLDLARAYIDMGDNEGAKSILE